MMPTGLRADWTARACMAMALFCSAGTVHAEALRGHLTGFGEKILRVDLCVRFFGSARAETMLAERRLDGVELNAGTFAVPLDHIDVPHSAEFVEIALRPSARRYAAFMGIPPRMRLRRLPGNVLVAVPPDPGLDAARPDRIALPISLDSGDLP